jgi:hypothetical protein
MSNFCPVSLDPITLEQGDDGLWYAISVFKGQSLSVPLHQSSLAFVSTFFTGDNCCDMSSIPFYWKWSVTQGFSEFEQKDFISATHNTVIASCQFNGFTNVDWTSFVSCMIGTNTTKTVPRRATGILIHCWWECKLEQHSRQYLAIVIKAEDLPRTRHLHTLVYYQGPKRNV